LPQRIDRLVAEGHLGPVILALPDGFTSLGGNQYVNSAAMGNWEDYLLDEMLPRLEDRFRIRRGPSHRAVFGKSSGGYGAMIQGMKHGDRWGGVACHSGDCGFDIVFRRDLPLALDVLAAHDGDVTKFVEHLRAADKIRGNEMYGLMMLALGATYDPDPSAPYGIRLPVDPETAELDPERWSRWLEHDPLTLVDRPECQASLRSLRGLFIDCGVRDQYFLHYGARALVRRLRQAGVRHRFEEFDDNHSGLDYRFDASLPFLYKVVA
jgi:S-formylglutathione hydrolase FrmB